MASEEPERGAETPPPSVLPVHPDTLPSTAKLSHDRYIQLLTFFGGLPGVAACVVLLWVGDWTPKVQWTFSALAIGMWLGCVAAVRERVVYPMQTLTNLLAALREGDYSLRSRRARRDDALGDVMREINALGETLSTRRREATEALALLRAIMAEIDVAVFTFDDARRLRLVNRTAARLLHGDDRTLIGRAADELGLADCLDGDTHRTLTADFPGRPGARWSLHRSSFREGGRPHQLLVLADVSASLREEERAAWQRLIRVLGHEINNSLTPIGSIAGSIGTLLERPEGQRAPTGRRTCARAWASSAQGRNHSGVLWGRTHGWRACPRRCAESNPGSTRAAGGGAGNAVAGGNGRRGRHRGERGRRPDRAGAH